VARPQNPKIQKSTKKFLNEMKKPDNTLEPTPNKNSINKITIGVLCVVGLMLIGCIIMLSIRCD